MPNRTRTARPRAEEGATLVEFSIVLPLLLLLMIGMMEIGAAFKDFMTVSAAAREGSRYAAFLGDEADADCKIVQQIADTLTTSLDQLVSIQIYQANQTTGAPVPGKTNTWTLIGDPTDCVLGWNSTNFWPAASRNVVFDPLGSPLDIVGVRIQVNRSWISGFPPFSGAYVVDESNIIRLEPEAFS
jgi:hypothetical protein